MNLPERPSGSDHGSGKPRVTQRVVHRSLETPRDTHLESTRRGNQSACRDQRGQVASVGLGTLGGSSVRLGSAHRPAVRSSQHRYVGESRMGRDWLVGDLQQEAQIAAFDFG